MLLPQGLEPRISCSVGRRLIHWATGASANHLFFFDLYSKYISGSCARQCSSSTLNASVCKEPGVPLFSLPVVYNTCTSIETCVPSLGVVLHSGSGHHAA